MKIAIVLFLFFLVFVGGGALLVMHFIKKTDPKNQDNTEATDIKTAQEFLPFEDIRDDMIVLNGHHYRSVIVCSSTNYELKTSGEREQIEIAFQRFLNSITFPITFFLQTKVIDNTDRLNQLQKSLEKTVKTFPNISLYADQYMADMKNINVKLQNTQQKKRYVIVTYDDVDELSQLNESEKAIHAARELRQRCQAVQLGLNDVGVKSTILSTADLVELVYSTYYRDDYSYAQAISDKDAFALIVRGEVDKFENMPRTKMLGQILGETINQMQLSNIDADPLGRDVIQQLREIREKYAASSDTEGVESHV